MGQHKLQVSTVTLFLVLMLGRNVFLVLATLSPVLPGFYLIYTNLLPPVVEEV
jgi:hypothetical protein